MSYQETSARPQVRHSVGQGSSVLRQAVAVLQAEYQVAEMSAYEMLVDRAVQAGTTVREAARVIIERAHATG